MGLDTYFDFMMMAGCDGCSDNLTTRLDVKQVKEALKFYLDVNPTYVKAISISGTLEEALSKNMHEGEQCAISFPHLSVLILTEVFTLVQDGMA